MRELIAELVALVGRTPAAVVETVTWGWRHPGAVGVLMVCSLGFGAFCYVNAYFHRPRNQER